MTESDDIVANILAYEASLSPLEFYRHRRAGLVRNARQWHKLVRMKFPADIAREKQRETQIAMVKLRYWHRTGTEPGTD